MNATVTWLTHVMRTKSLSYSQAILEKLLHLHNIITQTHTTKVYRSRCPVIHCAIVNAIMISLYNINFCYLYFFKKSLKLTVPIFPCMSLFILTYRKVSPIFILTDNIQKCINIWGVNTDLQSVLIFEDNFFKYCNTLMH